MVSGALIQKVSEWRKQELLSWGQFIFFKMLERNVASSENSDRREGIPLMEARVGDYHADASLLTFSASVSLSLPSLLMCID